ncbi:MAG TPA: 50S ribosomal protein L23 [Nitrososphaerales archaeon]|nr:50S ribosomal protein L23 [Nitrososphaerales archaeon]
MRLEDAQKLIVRPYITERTFDQVARENKICFLVADGSTKSQIASAVEALYDVKVRDVNTLRSIGGKKAFVRLVPENSATDLATKLGLV